MDIQHFRNTINKKIDETLKLINSDNQFISDEFEYKRIKHKFTDKLDILKLKEIQNDIHKFSQAVNKKLNAKLIMHETIQPRKINLSIETSLISLLVNKF